MSTTTTRLGLVKPASTENIDITTLNANSDKTDNAVGALICTSTTRPSSPFSGQQIWQTDTSSGFVYVSGTWLPVTSQPAPVALADAATIAVDATKGNHFSVTLGGNRTLGNPTGLVDGQKLLFELIQDATGSRTITLGSAYALGTDVSAVVLTTTAGKRDFMGTVYRSGTSKLYVVGFSKGY